MNSTAEKRKPVKRHRSNREQLKALIAKHPFGKGLSPLHLGTLTDYAMMAEFAPGQEILRQGELANRFYLLFDGEVSLEHRLEGSTPNFITKLGGGDVLGWSWMFEPYLWHFDARALAHTRAIFFYGTWLREFCDLNPELGYGLIKRMAHVLIRRLQATREQLAEAKANHDKTAQP